MFSNQPGNSTSTTQDKNGDYANTLIKRSESVASLPNPISDAPTRSYLNHVEDNSSISSFFEGANFVAEDNDESRPTMEKRRTRLTEANLDIKKGALRIRYVSKNELRHLP